MPVSGSSSSLVNELSPGVVFWRVHASGRTSYTWQFTVPAGNAPNSTSWGTTLDVNGDGYADVVVGAPADFSGSAGYAYVYTGSASGLATLPTPFTDEDTTGAVGWSVASAGDVDGDGYADVIVGTMNEDLVYLYAGGPDFVLDPPGRTALNPPVGANGGFGNAVASAGDVNLDGYADVVVNAPGTQGQGGQVFVYLGGPSGLSSSPATTLTGDQYALFGAAIAGACDVNGDGYADIIVGAAGTSMNSDNPPYPPGQAFVYFGGPSGITSANVMELTINTPTDGNAFGASVACAGDVGGTGYAGVIVGAPASHATDAGGQGSGGAAYVFFGAAHFTGTGATTLSGAGYGWAVASAGDVNGDGFSDVIIGGGGALAGAYLFLGPTLTAAPLSVPDGASAELGWSVSATGDVQGNGFGGVIVGDIGANLQGEVFYYPGSGSGLGSAVTLDDPQAMEDDEFGYSVFGSTD